MKNCIVLFISSCFLWVPFWLYLALVLKNTEQSVPTHHRSTSHEFADLCRTLCRIWYPFSLDWKVLTYFVVPIISLLLFSEPFLILLCPFWNEGTQAVPSMKISWGFLQWYDDIFSLFPLSFLISFSIMWYSFFLTSTQHSADICFRTVYKSKISFLSGCDCKNVILDVKLTLL